MDIKNVYLDELTENIIDEKQKILIVDDVEINREILNSILEDKYDVYQAINGREAIDIISSGQHIFSLVLLDLIMPDIDGFGVLEYLNENKLIDELPVVVITSEKSDDAVLKAYSMGALDVCQKPFNARIIHKRLSNIFSLYEQRYRDKLTGGYNRKGFIRRAKNIIDNANEPKDYAVMFFNINKFKAVNDLLGFEGGDYVLRFFYNELAGSEFKPQVTARISADHYACLVKKENIDFKYLTARMEETLHIKNKNIRLFSGCGIYYVEDVNVPISGMIDRAHMASKHIIDGSVKPYAIYDSSMRDEYVDNAEILAEFEDGIANDEFKIYYQPVVDAKSNKLVSAEALVRWIHPEKGFISPGSFIPTLEKNGYITRLDQYVLENVNDMIAKRLMKGLAVVPVSVNLSWMDFYDENMIRKLFELLNNGDMTNQKIRLEVTETSYAALEENRTNLLNNMRTFGAIILMDDFGSGYSSFGMLGEYNFDILKIDMMFIKQLEYKPKIQVIVKGIIDMCHSLGIKVVAEGVETEGQKNFLMENQCDYIQGYYYSRPLAESDFIEFIKNYDSQNMILK